jgi:hypothetical protein
VCKICQKVIEVIKVDARVKRKDVDKAETKNITRESPLLTLPGALQNHVLMFLGNKVVTENKDNIFQAAHRDYKIEDKDSKVILTRTTNLFSNVNVLYHVLTQKIAHNLLFHIEIEKTLELVRNNQQCLYIEVEIKDPHGQRVRNHLVGILSSAGDRNTREMKPDEKPDGLVERLGSCFKNPDDFKAQRENWEKNCEAATAITMAPYEQAIRTLCLEIIDSKEIPIVDSESIEYEEFEQLLNLSIAQKFRNALKPNPDYVVTDGFLFDMQIFLYFIEQLKRLVGNNDEKNTLGSRCFKSAAFDAIAYPALQFRSEIGDRKIFKRGIGNVVDKKQSPDSRDYSAVVGAGDLVGFGVTHFFDFHGMKWEAVGPGGCVRSDLDSATLFFESCVNQKRKPVEQLISHTKRVLDEPEPAREPQSRKCLIM